MVLPIARHAISTHPSLSGLAMGYLRDISCWRVPRSKTILARARGGTLSVTVDKVAAVGA